MILYQTEIKSALNLSEIFTNITTDYLPMFINILLGIVIFIIGYIIAKIIYKIIFKTLKAIKLDKVDDMLRQVDMFKTLDLNLPKVIAKLVYFFILLLVIQISVAQMGIQSLSNGLGAIMAYIPRLLTAAVIFIIGVFIANIIKNALRTTTDSLNIKTGKFLSDSVFYFLVIIIALTALNQAGINTELITNNLTLLIGGILLAFMIGFGFASKDLMASMLSSVYVKDTIAIGDKLKINNTTGEVVELTSTAVIIKSAEGALISIPMSKLSNEVVEITK